MSVDLRQILDRYSIYYRDRGKNVSRGNIVVSCPWCDEHGSEHLAISLESPEYYCFRNPRHSGGSFALLFKALNLPPDAYKGLEFKTTIRTQKHDSNNYSIFRFFQHADESQEALDYLTSRLFEDPVKVCRQFDLRVGTEGRWAGRLLIPLTVGWTGRAMRPHISLRYDAYTNEDGFFIYGNSSSVIIQEGALDSMRIASVTSEFTVIAMTGKKLTPAMLLRLRLMKPSSIYFLPDSDVLPSEYFNYTKQLRSYVPWAPVKRLKLPANVKDTCLLQEDITRNWLYKSTAA